VHIAQRVGYFYYWPTDVKAQQKIAMLIKLYYGCTSAYTTSDGTKDVLAALNKARCDVEFKQAN